MTPRTTTKQLLTNVLLSLSNYHPIVIEGMGNYDPRDPSIVARHIYEQLQDHWASKHQHSVDNNTVVINPPKPKLIIIQGDPLNDQGISAITPLVAKLLGVSRGLICLDSDLAPYHAPNADRANVILELQYSDLTQVLEDRRPGIMMQLEQTIDRCLQEKNQRRLDQDKNKPPLKDYIRNFALLQEVTKGACLEICGDVTIAHTAQDISDFSVTSFYEAGLELGLVNKDQMVPYKLSDDLDFESIDKR